MAEGKEKANVVKESTGMYALAAIVAIAILAAAVYYSGFFGQPPAPQPPGSAELPLSTPEAKLLLASFDSGAALDGQGYMLRYSANDSGARSNYALVKNGADSWIGVQDSFGRREGFFGEKNTTDTICLEYQGTIKCAMAGNNSDLANIAATRLKPWQPKRDPTLAMKDEVRKLIYAGVIRLESGMTNEKVGNFTTKKIMYTLDYRNLTVQQMVSMGIKPETELISLVTFWIDDKTGLIVKSHATFESGGAPGFYDTEYHEVSVGPGAQLPPRPETLVPVEAFASFYSTATADFSKRAACLSSIGKERNACYKNIAVEKNSPEICKLINETKEYESCVLIVAQNTKNHALCGGLQMLGDECYIAVASVTGNFELCRGLKNQSLGSACNQAATAGQRLVAEREAAAAKLYATRNCASDVDCKVFGNAGQYCAPKSSTTQFAVTSDPVFACLEGVPCGCQDGFCGFAKNESYYSCMNRVEDEMMEDYIRSLIPNNQTVNITKTDIG